MSFLTAVENVELTVARTKLERLLIWLPADEADALEELLRNTNLSADKLEIIMASEGEEHNELEMYSVSASAIKRWRLKNNVTATPVLGL